MRKFSKLLLIGMVVALIGALALPISAQDQEPGPGTGGPVVEPNFGGSDIVTLNPIVTADGSSRRVQNRLYPGFISYDPFTLGYEAGGHRGAIVTGWDISEDGLTYTFHLRDDWSWSDGTPITSADYLYSYDAVASGEVEAPGSLLGVLDSIESVVAVDDYTIEITFLEADCGSLSIADTIPVVPAHYFTERFPNYADMNEANFLEAPVSAGDFTFANFRPGEQVTLLASQDYPDALLGFVVPEGWVFRNVADQNAQVEQFREGVFTFMGVPQSFQEEFREAAANGEYQISETPISNPRYIFWNLADPTNPQSATDDEGNPLDQGHHPVFGDVRVRQALAMGMDFDAINEGVFFGGGVPMAVPVAPWSWAYNPDLAPWAFDPDRAGELLTEAGWTDEDGDGVRECHGCLYAEEGAPLEFDLITNAGNTSNESLGAVLQDQWGRLGVRVNFTPVDFNVLVETLLGQTHDAVLIFLGVSVPDNPDDLRTGLTPVADELGAGFNTGSYNNPRVNELLDQARVLPGCNQDERRALYWEAMEIIREEMPWLPFGSSLVTTVAQPNVANWEPTIGVTRWNIDAWFVFEAES